MDTVNWTGVGIAIFAFVGFLFWFFPMYGIWASHKSGLADLALAENESKVQVMKANARLLAAEANKKAAIVEAEAVASQIKLIGDNLKTDSLYLRWQWIKMMEETDNHTTIYVPTEAALPILEATRDKS